MYHLCPTTSYNLSMASVPEAGRLVGNLPYRGIIHLCADILPRALVNLQIPALCRYRHYTLAQPVPRGLELSL